MRGAKCVDAERGFAALDWGEALETRLFPESYGRLARVGDVPGAAGMGGCVLFLG